MLSLRTKNILASCVVVFVLAGLMFIPRGGIGTGGHAPPAFATPTTLELAAAAEKANGLPVLVFVTADWCGPCKSLKAGALQDEQVTATILEKTHPVLVDATETNPDVAALNVDGFPTLLLLRNGKETSRLVGGVDTGRLQRWLDQSLKAR